MLVSFNLFIFLFNFFDVCLNHFFLLFHVCIFVIFFLLILFGILLIQKVFMHLFLFRSWLNSRNCLIFFIISSWNWRLGQWLHIIFNSKLSVPFILWSLTLLEQEVYVSILSCRWWSYWFDTWILKVKILRCIVVHSIHLDKHFFLITFLVEEIEVCFF